MDATADEMNYFASFMLKTYQTKNWKSEDLSEYFSDDFSDYCKEYFADIDSDISRELRDHLRDQGVYNRKGRSILIAEDLY